MKRSILIILLMAASFMLEAQQPMFFHNRLENLSYQMENPSGFPIKPKEHARALNDYTLKLDSVVGSDNFDWTRWKDCYTYQGDTIVEISYEWQNQTWVPTVMSETSDDQVKGYRWTEEGWEPYTTVSYQYLDCSGQQLLESMTTTRLVDSVWEPYIKSDYEYDENCNLLFNINYNGVNASGEWRENSKYEYAYNENGQLETMLYSTIREGSWRESQKVSYTYNEQGQCTSLLTQRKGGWGPNANSWMDSYRYDFEYENGELVSELYYVAIGWFGGEMSLDSKSEYAFDINGNEKMKTASIFNEVDWIVRDTYENTFDVSVEASSILGLAPVWSSMLGTGMGFVLDIEMPLFNKWRSCSIVSNNLDTQFELYYSGFADVEEHFETGIVVCSRQGGLVVELDQPADVTVYDLLGRVVASKSQISHGEFYLTPGLYIVGNGTSMVKAVVR